MKRFLTGLFIVLLCLMFVSDAGARAGYRSGRSSLGYRGSRTYTPPAKPGSPAQTQTQQQAQTPAAPAQPPAYQPPIQQPGMFGGFGRSLMAGLAGGLIGSLLLSSLGYGATAPGTGGFGLLEFLLAGLGILLIVRFLRRKKETFADRAGEISPAQALTPERRGDDFLKDLKRADTNFDPEAFRKEASDVFIKVQDAWKNRDLAPVEKKLTPDLFYGMKRELERMTGEGSVSHIEKIHIKDASITEAWQEEGLDYVTVRISVEALSRTTDAAGSTIGEGKTQAAFSEYWTFVREIWLGGWKLTAIQQEPV